jgi:hypothetical protein
MRSTFTAVTVVLVATLAQAQAQTSGFDGAWNVTLTCPPANDTEGTKGYTHLFPFVIDLDERAPSKKPEAPVGSPIGHELNATHR